MAITKQKELYIEGQPTGVLMEYHRVEEINMTKTHINFQVLSYESEASFNASKGHLAREYFSYPKNSALALFSEADQRLAGNSITTLIEDELVADTTNLSQDALNLRFVGFLTNGIRL